MHSNRKIIWVDDALEECYVPLLDSDSNIEKIRAYGELIICSEENATEEKRGDVCLKNFKDQLDKLKANSSEVSYQYIFIIDVMIPTSEGNLSLFCKENLCEISTKGGYATGYQLASYLIRNRGGTGIPSPYEDIFKDAKIIFTSSSSYQSSQFECADDIEVFADIPKIEDQNIYGFVGKYKKRSDAVKMFADWVTYFWG